LCKLTLNDKLPDTKSILEKGKRKRESYLAVLTYWSYSLDSSVKWVLLARLKFKPQKQANYYSCFEDIHLHSLLEISLQKMPNSFPVELTYVFLFLKEFLVLELQ
jgi:hypothetical protein